MNTEKHNSRIEILAYKIWEEQGRPEGRHEENWAEAERRLRFESDGAAGSDSPPISDDPVAPSRTQTASPASDSKSGSSRRARQR